MSAQDWRSTPPWSDLISATRARFRGMTAYRLGIVVGEQGVRVACPYDTPRSIGHFNEGVAYGRIQAEKKLALGKIEFKAKPRAGSSVK